MKSPLRISRMVIAVRTPRRSVAVAVTRAGREACCMSGPRRTPTSSSTLPPSGSMPYWRATAGLSEAVGTTLARMVTSPARATASSMVALACPSGGEGDPHAASRKKAAAVAQAGRMALLLRAAARRGFVVGGGELAAALGGAVHRAGDEVAQTAAFE